MHSYFHDRFGFCIWDVGALIVLIVMIVVLVVHMVRQKKREQEFEEKLSAQMAQNTTRRENRT